jgi:hypothetical protein
MTALSVHLERLLGFVDGGGLQPPSRDLRIVEVHNDQVDLRTGKSKCRRDDLRTPSDYAARFDELLSMGYAWLNMSCYGVWENVLLVAIEVPGSKQHSPGSFTSVNLSGPSRAVLDRGWSVETILTVE